MTRYSSFFGLSALLFVFTGCEQKGGPLRVDAVDPPQGVASGGDSVVIKGSGFQPGKTQVDVRFGRMRADQVIVSSTNKINVITPPGDRGPVDVTVMFDNGEHFKIPQGFSYQTSGGASDVRKAFFSDKPGDKPAGTTPTNTTPPAPAK